MAACCFSKEGGGGGGAVLATTGRLIKVAGGRTRAGAPEPITACLGGAMEGAATPTGAAATSLWLTATRLRETGCAEVKACGDVAVTAPETPWFTYLTLLTFTFLLITVVL